MEEGIQFSVKFGTHLCSRDAFATVELCKSFGDVVAQLSPVLYGLPIGGKLASDQYIPWFETGLSAKGFPAPP